MEATLEEAHPIDPRRIDLHVAIRKVYADTAILADGEPDRINPDRWHPLLCNFQHSYGLGDGKVQPIRTCENPQGRLSPPAIDRSIR